MSRRRNNSDDEEDSCVLVGTPLVDLIPGLRQIFLKCSKIIILILNFKKRMLNFLLNRKDQKNKQLLMKGEDKDFTVHLQEAFRQDTLIGLNYYFLGFNLIRFKMKFTLSVQVLKKVGHHLLFSHLVRKELIIKNHNVLKISWTKK